MRSVKGYQREGFDAVKIKVGLPTLADDVARVAAVRRCLGPNARLMVDANYGLSVDEAIASARAFAPHDLLWFEEPTDPDDLEGYTRIAQSTALPLAMGENLHTRHDFTRALVTARLSYLQPAAGNCGGITGWLEAAQLAHDQGVALCSHGMQELHVSLLPGQPGGGWLEVHSFPIDRYTTRPLGLHEHRALAPHVPGTGVKFDWARLEAAVQLDGYSSYGSVDQYAVSATVQAGAGLPPTAQAAALPSSGTVPLTVNFSSAGSSDSDGNIVAFDWTFGDGTGATGAPALHTYNTAGPYSAQLRVTDNSGPSSTRSVAITANPTAVLMPLRVADINMSLRVLNSSWARATARVMVRNGNGQPVVGATVSGIWGGVVAGSASVMRGGDGVASFSSGKSRALGSVIVTVIGITLAGHQYQPALNTETSDAITR